MNAMAESKIKFEVGKFIRLKEGGKNFKKNRQEIYLLLCENGSDQLVVTLYISKGSRKKSSSLIGGPLREGGGKGPGH